MRRDALVVGGLLVLANPDPQLHRPPGMTEQRVEHHRAPQTGSAPGPRESIENLVDPGCERLIIERIRDLGSRRDERDEARQREDFEKRWRREGNDQFPQAPDG
jgi:hypothetical protein